MLQLYEKIIQNNDLKEIKKLIFCLYYQRK